MSLILKALQKVEKERSKDRPERPSFGKSPLAGKIVGEVTPFVPAIQSHRWLPLMVLVLLAGTTFGALFLLPRSDQSKPAPAETQVIVQSVPPVLEKEPPVTASLPEPLPEPLSTPSVTDSGPLSSPDLPVLSATPPEVATPTPTLQPLETIPATPTISAPGKPLEKDKPVVKKLGQAPKKKAAAKRPAQKTSAKVAAAKVKAKGTSIPQRTIPVLQAVSSKSGSKSSPIDKKPSKNANLSNAPVVSRTHGWALDSEDLGPVPRLKITEIHYRSSAKERLAVVNGLPVLEGVDIDGARVDRIFKDRIRFVVNGRYLEVKLDPSTTPQTTPKP